MVFLNMLNLLFPLLIFCLFACQNIPAISNANPKPISTQNDNRSLDTLQLKLNKKVNESSGLVRIGNQFWTHNDSGGKAALYQIDPESGALIKTVVIENADNRDWEDLAKDSTHLYIGDFGNNRGGRKDLVIYKVSIAELNDKTSITADLIQFNYSDQQKYYSSYQHNHDCEAMIAHGDKLFLFSKNWLDRKCKLYELPKNAGTYTVSPISEFDAMGTITAATISDEGQFLFLLGYIPGDGFDPFIWRISDWGSDHFFEGQMKRIDLTPRRQTEGVCIYNESELLISSEAEGSGYPTLFTFPQSF